MKKNILVIGPITPVHNEFQSIAETLVFLEENYRITFLDPLSLMSQNMEIPFYALWRQKIASLLDDYEAFIGFSFGGVILQQCFPLFTKQVKSIILFSTPSFTDNALKIKLNHIIDLCNQDSTLDAITLLYQTVYYPNPVLLPKNGLFDPISASKRLVFGLSLIRDTDSRPILEKTKIQYTHFIGEHSKLVNKNHIVMPNSHQTYIVPNAGMRVLQDNPAFCHPHILSRLQND